MRSDLTREAMATFAEELRRWLLVRGLRLDGGNGSFVWLRPDPPPTSNGMTVRVDTSWWRDRDLRRKQAGND